MPDRCDPGSVELQFEHGGAALYHRGCDAEGDRNFDGIRRSRRSVGAQVAGRLYLQRGWTNGRSGGLGGRRVRSSRSRRRRPCAGLHPLHRGHHRSSERRSAEPGRLSHDGRQHRPFAGAAGVQPLGQLARVRAALSRRRARLLGDGAALRPDRSSAAAVRCAEGAFCHHPRLRHGDMVHSDHEPANDRPGGRAESRACCDRRLAIGHLRRCAPEPRAASGAARHVPALPGGRYCRPDGTHVHNHCAWRAEGDCEPPDCCGLSGARHDRRAARRREPSGADRGGRRALLSQRVSDARLLEQAGSDAGGDGRRLVPFRRSRPPRRERIDSCRGAQKGDHQIRRRNHHSERDRAPVAPGAGRGGRLHPRPRRCSLGRARPCGPRRGRQLHRSGRAAYRCRCRMSGKAVPLQGAKDLVGGADTARQRHWQGRQAQAARGRGGRPRRARSAGSAAGQGGMMRAPVARGPGAAHGRRVLVTGGATGIGRALCVAMAARGDRVLTCGRRSELLDAVKAEHPAIDVLACDIGREQDRRRLGEAVEARLGGLDILVNNAGVQHIQSYGAGSLQEADVESEVRVNLIAPMLIVDRLLPILRQSPSPAIVNVVSLLAVTPKANAPGYCASKAGLLAFTRALRLQLSDEPIRVIAVFPPLVDTPMTAGRGLSKMSSEQFAAALMAALDSGRENIAIGEAARALALARWFPALAERAMRRMIRPSAGAASGSKH